ncbi:MAG TPA: trypsin-like peptidase domain-containing protein [Thermoanaerobaculia bacterium]|nr:trypsin-like peptidase domain-containing protein [Thermoanaerobaculia bacterium]
MTTRRSALAAAALVSGLLYTASGGRAQSVEGAWMPPAAESRTAPAPRLQLESALATAPLHTLPPASAGAADQLAALQAWNAAGRLPFKNGFTRVLTSPAIVRLGGVAGVAGRVATPRPFAGGLLAAGGTGELAWGTRVTVQDAYRLRLHLSDVHLPAGTRMWVESQGGTPREFGLELLSPQGGLWTPSVKGDSLLFEVHVPAGAAAASFAVREVLELVDLAHAGAGVADTGEASCVIDSSCSAANALSNLATYRHAMAQLFFVDQNQGFICSGGLLADTKSDFIPYLLTANHCFADQSAASSLEAVFDYFTSSCNGTPPDETTLPTAFGGYLLATNTKSDFTFVRLFSPPDSNRFFLGWNASAGALTQGTQLFRLSFPAPGSTIDPERYSQSFVQLSDHNFPDCGNLQPPFVPKPRPDFIYGQLQKGGTFGGSSGAPLLLANGEVVGQLGGGCAFSGHDVNNGCDYANSEFDGAFSVTFPSIATWLSPTVAPGACVPGATTLCIDQIPGDRRFKIQVSYATSQGGGQSGSGQAISGAGLGVTQGGLFWFFQASNPELLVKILDGCSLTSHFWLFYAATTNVGFIVTVTDTVALNQQTYTNQDLQSAVPVQDTSALPCP